MLYNFHTHTTYCDGKTPAEEMVQKAIEIGFSKIGFSGHSYTEFDLAPCMSQEGTEEYKKEINRLKEKYADKIEIFLGVEFDYHSTDNLKGYDYVLGSVHYILKNGDYCCVDLSREEQINAVNKHYNGDFYAYIEDYYKHVADLYNKSSCDIVAHFDLIRKYNDDGSLFDTNHPRYVAAWKSAADAIINSPAVVEINTGGMARGHVNEPYPSKEIIEYFKANGKKVIFASDCHNKELLLCGYDMVNKYL